MRRACPCLPTSMSLFKTQRKLGIGAVSSFVTSASRWQRAVENTSEGAEGARRRAVLRIADIDRIRPGPKVLVDNFNRKHDYLRISLTERCNLRCVYCMPSEGVQLSPIHSILADDEIIRLSGLFVRSGITKIRLTGGEPTVRKGIVDIITRLNSLRSLGLKSIAMTSNGLALHRKLPTLVDNGLTHLNLSLDTLDPFKFEIMTRRQGHEMVLRTLDLASQLSGLESLKLNVVVMRGVNDSEVLNFVELTKDRRISVRFIEFMPFTGNKWDKGKLLPSSELLSRISAVHPGIRKSSDEMNDTARNYVVPGYHGSIGFISSMSDHFCASCNRLRITADGQIKVCLFDSREVSLRDLMRSGASDAELLEVVQVALGAKKEKHESMEDIDVVNNRPMILIGGIKNRRTPTLPHQSHLLKNERPGRLLARLMSTTTHSISDSPPSGRLTHIDDQGRPSMVDVSQKDTSRRSATAQGRIRIPKVAFDLIMTRHEDEPGAPSEDSELNEMNQRRQKARSKGDVLTVAQLAGVMGSKRTADLIPLCHTLPLSHVSVTLATEKTSSPPRTTMAGDEGDNESTEYDHSIICSATAVCEGKTGVEMEALTAVSVSLLTVWDMLKAVAGKDMVIGDIYVTRKTGGKSGDFSRPQEKGPVDIKYTRELPKHEQ